MGSSRMSWRLLDEIQKSLFQRALKFREEHTTRVSSYEEFKTVMEGRPGFVIAQWCGSADCEAQIKADTQATLRNIPFGSETGRRDLREMRQAVARRALVREVGTDRLKAQGPRLRQELRVSGPTVLLEP